MTRRIEVLAGGLAQIQAARLRERGRFRGVWKRALRRVYTADALLESPC